MVKKTLAIAFLLVFVCGPVWADRMGYHKPDGQTLAQHRIQHYQELKDAVALLDPSITYRHELVETYCLTYGQNNYGVKFSNIKDDVNETISAYIGWKVEKIDYSFDSNGYTSAAKAVVIFTRPFVKPSSAEGKCQWEVDYINVDCYLPHKVIKVKYKWEPFYMEHGQHDCRLWLKHKVCE